MVGLLERIEAAEIAQADVMAQEHEDKMLARSGYYSVLMWVFRFVGAVIVVIAAVYSSDADSSDAALWAALIFPCYAIFYICHEKSQHIKTIQRYRSKLDTVTSDLVQTSVDNENREDVA